MSDLTELLKTKGFVWHSDGASDISISSAEEKLNLTFAQDYKEYLKDYSLLIIDSHELTGIAKTPRMNVVDVTLREKAENEHISDDMYLIESVGMENLTIWQNSAGEIFEVAYMQEPKKISDSLIEYVSRF